MYAKAKIGGFLHLCIGEEATVVGATQALNETDYLMSTYREHGQALARGTDPNAVMAELFGREDGCSKGRGGSMHLFDWERRFLGGYGIVGGSLPLSAGRGARLRLPRERRRDPLDDGRRRHQPGHLRRDDEPGGALEAARRLPDNQQPVRHGHGAAPPLGGDGSVAQVRGLRRTRHALRRHGRARRPRGGDRSAQIRPRRARAAARGGGDLPLPRPLDGRPRGVPLQGGGRGVAPARPDPGIRGAPGRRGRAFAGRGREARPGGDRAGGRGSALRRRVPVPRPRLALRRRLRLLGRGPGLVDGRRALPRGAPRRARARGGRTPPRARGEGRRVRRRRRPGGPQAPRAEGPGRGGGSAGSGRGRGRGRAGRGATGVRRERGGVRRRGRRARGLRRSGARAEERDERGGGG